MEPERGCGEKGPGKREREAGTMNIQTGAGVRVEDRDLAGGLV